MRSITEWLQRRLQAWLRVRGVTGAASAVGTRDHTPPPAPEPALPAEKLLAWFLDCGRELLLRGRDDQAVLCLLDALRLDSTASAFAVAERMSGAGSATLTACLRLCATALKAPTTSVVPPWGRLPPSAPMQKISVVICSIDDERFAAASTSYASVLAAGPYEIIRIPDALSLAEGYNRGLDQSSGDIVVFSHDDVRVLAPDFRAELTAALAAYDMVGVAGTTHLDGPQWMSCPPAARRQLVCYPPADDDGDWLCAVDGSDDERWSGGIQALDGLFIAARRDVLAGLRFDVERYDGFHLYDLDLSYRAYKAGLRLAVCPRLGLLHFSYGNFDSPAWRRYAAVFCAQHGLPMVFCAPTPALGLPTEGQLLAFLAAKFSWQDMRTKFIGVADGTEGRQIKPLPDGMADIESKTLLHVGCGMNRREDAAPGFQSAQWREVRLDADPAVKPDLVGSMTDLSAVATASVDAVFSSHTLEHLYLHEVPVALAEIRRVLSDTGVTVAWVPDLQVAARLIADDKLYEVIGTTPFGPLTPFDIVFSHRGAVGRDRPFMAHHCGFTLSSLVSAHRDAGFRSVVGRPRIAGFDLQVLATRAVLPAGLLQALAALHFQD